MLSTELGHLFSFQKSVPIIIPYRRRVLGSRTTQSTPDSPFCHRLHPYQQIRGVKASFLALQTGGKHMYV